MNWLQRIIERIREVFRRLRELLANLSGGGGTIADDKCCHLARPDKECRWFGNKSNYTCPEGFHRQWWYCCEGTRQVGCGECTESTETCWSGPFDCSIWWYTGEGC